MKLGMLNKLNSDAVYIEIGKVRLGVWNKWYGISLRNSKNCYWYKKGSFSFQLGFLQIARNNQGKS